MYWDKVLKEVTDKSSTSRPQFTSIRCQAAPPAKKRDYNNSFKTRKLKMDAPEQDQEISFSRRETECLLCFVEGKTAKEAAKELNLSPRTVEFYAKNMRKKVGCRSKAELVRFVRNGDFIRLWDKDAE